MNIDNIVGKIKPDEKFTVIKDSSEDIFKLNERFLTIQGEGATIGKLSYFVRLQICNLTCSWCDTKYTWYEASDKKAWSKVSLNDLIEVISKQPARNVVLSGGEPTLHNFSKLVARMPDHTFEVESNGTIIPWELHGDKWLDSITDKVQWNISPKYENAKQVIIPDSLEKWSKYAQTHRNVIFKFVVRKSELDIDFKSVLDMVNRFEIPRDKVYIMPEGISRKVQSEDLEPLVDRIVQEGMNFSPRVHDIIWDGARSR